MKEITNILFNTDREETALMLQERRAKQDHLNFQQKELGARQLELIDRDRTYCESMELLTYAKTRT